MARYTIDTWQLALAAGRSEIGRAEPYWYAGISGLPVVVAPGLGTFGVTAAGTLMVDPEPAMAWHGDGTLPGVLVHEWLHVWFRDGARRGGRDPRTWNMATDCRSNDMILRAGTWRLPDGAVTPASLGLPEHLTAEQYYDLLVAQQAQQAQQQQQQGGDEQGDGEQGDDAASGAQGRDPAGGDPSPSPGDDRAPAGGSGGEEAPPWEVEGGEGEGEGEGQGQGGGGGGGKPKPGWGRGSCGSGAGGEPLPGEAEADAQAGGGHSAAALEGLRRAVAEAVRQHVAQHGQGRGTGDLATWADEILRPPTVRWQDQIRRLVRGSMAYQAGNVESTYTRPSKRQAGCGYGPGRPVLPGLHAPVPRVVFLQDTSGSMGTAEQTECMSEVAGVLRTLQCSVKLYCADDAVTGVDTLRGVSDLHRVTLRGGGGTDFGVPLQHVMESERTPPDVIIYLTDGYGSWGPERHDVVVIWAVLGNGPKPPWGHYVKVGGDQ